MGCVSEKALCLQYIYTTAPSGADVRACVLSAVTLQQYIIRYRSWPGQTSAHIKTTTTAVSLLRRTEQEVQGNENSGIYLTFNSQSTAHVMSVNCSRHVGQLLTSRRSATRAMSVNCARHVGQLLTSRRSTAHVMSVNSTRHVGQLLTSCRSTAHAMLVKCTRHVGQLLTSCRSTAHAMSRRNTA